MMKPSGMMGGTVGKSVLVGPKTIDLSTAFSNPAWRQGSGESCYFKNDYYSTQAG